MRMWELSMKCFAFQNSHRSKQSRLRKLWNGTFTMFRWWLMVTLLPIDHHIKLKYFVDIKPHVIFKQYFYLSLSGPYRIGSGVLNVYILICNRIDRNEHRIQWMSLVCHDDADNCGRTEMKCCCFYKAPMTIMITLANAKFETMENKWPVCKMHKWMMHNHKPQLRWHREGHKSTIIFYITFLVCLSISSLERYIWMYQNIFGINFRCKNRIRYIWVSTIH